MEYTLVDVVLGFFTRHKLRKRRERQQRNHDHLSLMSYETQLDRIDTALRAHGYTRDGVSDPRGTPDLVIEALNDMLDSHEEAHETLKRLVDSQAPIYQLTGHQAESTRIHEAFEQQHFTEDDHGDDPLRDILERAFMTRACVKGRGEWVDVDEDEANRLASVALSVLPKPEEGLRSRVWQLEARVDGLRANQADVAELAGLPRDANGLDVRNAVAQRLHEAQESQTLALVVSNFGPDVPMPNGEEPSFFGFYPNTQQGREDATETAVRERSAMPERHRKPFVGAYDVFRVVR